MSHLAPVNQIPSKKKGTLFKPQRNTLDKYFNSPKKNLEYKPLSAGKNPENEQNPVTNMKRKIQPKNNVVNAKLIKMDDTSQKKMPAEVTSHGDQMQREDIPFAKEIGIVKIKQQPKSRATVNFNHDKDKIDIYERKNTNNDHKSYQPENQHSENITLLKMGRIIPKNVAHRIALTVNEAFDKVQASINDSVEIDTVDTPKQQTSQTEETKSITNSPNEISNSRASKDETNNEISKYPLDESELPPKKKVSATTFKEIIYSFCHNDFSKPYRKLNYLKSPECCDLGKCRALHMGSRRKEVNSFQYGHVFNVLDSPLSEWLCDILPAISLVMTRDQYLRGDMLRVMFYYILNGPNDDLMWDIKTVLESHWSLHPPCTDHMQGIYLDLLDRRYPYDSFFKTDLTNSGVLHYIMNQMEKVLKSEKDAENITGHNNKTNDPSDDQISNPSQSKLTFEVLEERYKNHQPLFEEERQEVMDTLDEFANSFQAENDLVALDDSEILNRLTVALELIVNLLEADFMISVARLKTYMKGECEMKEPLIKHFMDDSFQSRVMKFYSKTTNKCTWKQLSRLIGLMAETVHLFKRDAMKMWKYPDLNPHCEEFALVVFEEFSKGGWDESGSLSRLQSLQPPWLQQRVTLAVANSYLNLDLGSGIQALVDIIHTHVISPVKLENDLKKIEPDPDKLRIFSEKLMKKSKKKNYFGETLLHQLCRNKKCSVEDVECVLALPETDVNAKDNHGWTALHEAVNSMSVAKTEMLLQFKPPPGKHATDVGIQNNDGITPLHEAVEANSLDLCQLLVYYGGICLLRKKNVEGVTPLMLAKKREEIRKYFHRVIKVQEELNLNSNSVLKLSDSMIRMCMLVCEAFIADHHTWELYQVVRFDKEYNRAAPEPWIAASSKEILLKFKHEQDHFRKLRKIIEKLAENQENSYLVRLWNDRFLYKE